MTSKDSKRASRDKLAEERRRQAQADKRRRSTINVVVGVLVVAVVIAVFVVVQNQRTTSDVTNASLPGLVSEQGGGMSFGNGPVKVDLWEDFQCPVCKQFEAANGAMLKQRIDNGDITLVIHPLSFLNQNLNNTSSTLAANAFGCSAAAGEKTALAYHTLLYDKQPEENAGHEAWTVDDLVGWGSDVGLTGTDWSGCVTDGNFNDWVSQVAASQIDAGVTGTPTVFIDGKRFD
ncbi:MAG TPA: thioredoxin domain-containing protein, partial [Actinomycetes bacterium]|nr:thioredoxin domain-containing protein [Actinomycetes bacterium]